MPRPIAIDLFSGAGGMSLGLEAAGFDIAASVEIDPIHANIHHFNFPYSVTICDDINNVNSHSLLRKIKERGWTQEIDLIAGGPPCQGFSCMGKRLSDDPRNLLIFQYLRIVKEIQPKYFIFENVPGMATAKNKFFLEQLIAEFVKIGYLIAEPKILDAQFFGAPQKRKRLILLGSRCDVILARYPEPLATSYKVGDAISDLAKIEAHIGWDLSIDAQQLDYSGYRYNFSPQVEGVYSLCHLRQVAMTVWGHVGSKHSDQCISRFLSTPPNRVERSSRLFKLSESGLCNTLRAGTSSERGSFTAPRPIHYSWGRCITIREAARLHTFPDWFRFHRTIWHGFREIGNAVVPMLSKVLGDQIIKALSLDAQGFDRRYLSAGDPLLLECNATEAGRYWNGFDSVVPKR